MHGLQTIKRLNSTEQAEVNSVMAEHAKAPDAFAKVAEEAIAKHHEQQAVLPGV